MSNRTLFSRETGHLVYDAAGTPATYFAEGSISLELSEDIAPLQSLLFGHLDDIPVGRMVKLKFIPQEFSTGAAGLLFPQRSLNIGDSLFGSADKTMDVHTVSGKRVRLSCVAVYKEPGIRGDIKKTVFGEVEYWGILGIDGDPNALASFINETTVSYPGAAGFDRTKAITPAWQCTWGASPFNAIDLDESGWTLTTKAKLKEWKPMGKGLCDVSISDYDLEVAFTPMNISRAAVMARMGMAVPLGGSKSSVAADFIAQGTGIYLQAYSMFMKQTDAFQFDAEKLTVGKITLNSAKTLSGGTRSSMLYLDTSD